MEMIRELRSALGLFAGAMPVSPKEAWEEAIGEVDKLHNLAHAYYKGHMPVHMH